jgi:hypothetical protein
MEFVEAPPFARNLRNYLDDDGDKELQAKLVENPEAGDLMPGTGSFRKMRWADIRRGKGGRGGLRVICYHLKSDSQIWLMALYGKNEASDLTTKQKKVLKTALESELEARASGRLTQRRIH